MSRYDDRTNGTSRSKAARARETEENEKTKETEKTKEPGTTKDAEEAAAQGAVKIARNAGRTQPTKQPEKPPPKTNVLWPNPIVIRASYSLRHFGH